MPGDAWTDLYSIGVVVLEAVSGRNPFFRVEAQPTIAGPTTAFAGWPPVKRSD
jgi:hypothetical protein